MESLKQLQEVLRALNPSGTRLQPEIAEPAGWVLQAYNSVCLGGVRSCL